MPRRTGASGVPSVPTASSLSFLRWDSPEGGTSFLQALRSTHVHTSSTLRIQCSDLGLRLVMTGFGAGRVLSGGASVRCYRSPHTMQRPGTAAGDDWFWGW
ncbi:hypothetical protein NDU88_000127 [Pleurodeles waltl]|uniref:Uncharacterized protein n=1 Tax=Pleurodeles waltl TaxID=8319 RepID=A0AAV7N723_PLEWA|nr:hypothetical protein NDU88_000127 [Pleurodeles waltl]